MIYEVYTRCRPHSDETWGDWEFYDAFATKEMAYRDIVLLNHKFRTEPEYDLEVWAYQVDLVESGLHEPTASLYSTDTAISMLGFALGYYISLGDLIGEALGWEEGDEIAIVIQYAPRELEDRDNWIRLEARLVELADSGIPLRIENCGLQESGFVGILLYVVKAHVPIVTRLLTLRPGPLGWGSARSELQFHGIIPSDE